MATMLIALNKQLRGYLASAAVLIVLWLLAWWPITVHMVGLWWGNEIFQYGLVVPFVSLWLMAQKSDVLVGRKPRVSLYGAALLLLASVLALGSRLLDVAIIGHFGVLLGVVAIIWMVLGDRITAVIRFGLFFLLLAVPFGSELIPSLQVFTAHLTLKLLDLLAVDYQAEGVIITLSSGTYRVARACAGVQFFMASTILSVLLAYLAFHSWRGRLLMVLAGLAVPILANALRVASILLIGEMSDSNFARGVDHIVYGWVFLSIVLAVVISLAYWLGNAASQPLRSPVLTAGLDAPRGSVHHVLLLLTMGMVTALVWQSWTVQSGDAVAVHLAPPDPVPLGAWRPLRAGLLAQEGAIFPYASDTDQRVFRNSSYVLLASTFTYQSQQPPAALLSAQNRLAGKGWYKLQGTEKTVFDAAGHQWQETYWRRGEQYQLVWHRYHTPVGCRTSAMSLKLALALSRLKQLGDAAAVEVISVLAASDRKPAREAIFSFVNKARMSTIWFGKSPKAEGAEACAE